jgi:phage baseplate assembly protein W
MSNINIPIFSEITQPFQVDTTGRIGSTIDPASVVEQHILALIMTNFGERVMRSNYGSGVPSHLFENIDAIGVQDLASSIQTAVSQWVPQAKIISVLPQVSTIDGTIYVQIQYQIVGSIPVHTIILNSEGQLVEQ